MDESGFRERLLDAARRVEERTGVDPLDVERSMSITTDARLELLPRSVGIGLAAMAVAIAIVCVRFLLQPETGPGYALTTAFVVVDVGIALGVAACFVLARSARARRSSNNVYEDAWARLAVEVWPPPRYQSWDGAPASGGGYSRTEFLLAVRDDAPLEPFVRRAPFTRMP